MLDNSDVVVRSTRAPAVTLVPYTAAHVETYHGWLASAALQHDTSSERLSLAEEHANQAEWMTRGDRCTFIVLLDSEAVGDVNLVAVGEEEGGGKVVEVDVMVAVAAVRGRGVGKRAVVLALAWAMRAGRGKVARFVVKILESNDASLALFGGLGFVEERRIAAFGEVHLGLGVDQFEKSRVHAVIGAWSDGNRFSAGDSAEEVRAAIGMDESEEILDKDAFATKLAANTWSFVDFFAPWCIHCVKLAPTWEAFAKTVHDKEIHVKVYRVDCTKNQFLCRQQQINGYPTLRVYKGQTAMHPDFLGKRTVSTLQAWMERMTDEHEHVNTREHKEEGCLVLGTLWVNRVPGNFHITAKSAGHDFDPKATNLSHIVHHFSFGAPLPQRVLRHLPGDVRRNINPLDGKVFVNREEHTTHEHYIKVVSTHYRVGKSSIFNRGDSLGYQMATSNHRYKSDPAVPEAKFSFDLSPTAVVIIQGGKRWYEFVTSVCAIIGGVFTVVSLLDGAVYNIAKTVKGSQGKQS